MATSRSSGGFSRCATTHLISRNFAVKVASAPPHGNHRMARMMEQVDKLAFQPWSIGFLAG